MAKKKRKKAPLADRKKNPNSKYWKGKADDVWSDEIKRIGYCEVCGATDRQLHSHHVISRTRLRFRYDLSNGVCLCARCHKLDADISPHQDSYGAENFLRWLKKERPGQWQWYEENKHDKRQPEWTYRDKYEELK